jgi:F-type H+-transporting ATPase subunit b
MLGPVSISVPTVIIELVIFLGMVWAMETLVFNPIRHAWAERDRLIQEGLAAAGHSREEAQETQEQIQTILAEARQAAQRAIDEGAAAGNRIREELVTQAQQEFRRLLDAALLEITAERERSAETLRTRIVDIALLAASRVTGQSYDQAQVRELAAAVVEGEGLT